MGRPSLGSITAVFGFLALTNLVSCEMSRVQWTKLGATNIEFDRDWQQCSKIASGLNPPVFDRRTMTTIPNQQATLQQRHACMFSRGWQLTPKE